MILVKTPLRITLGGGGTDLPFYYKKKNGFCVTASIKYYTYITITKTFHKNYILKYSINENVKKINDIEHKIFKDIYKQFKVNQFIETTSLADIPSGTGLGSSASFTVGLCVALNKYFKRNMTLLEITKLACQREMFLTNHLTGKQDQYAVSNHGINAFEFYKNEKVKKKTIKLNDNTKKKFEERFVLVFSNHTRSTSSVLDQQKKFFIKNKKLIKYYDGLKNLGYQSYLALKNNDLDLVGEILNDQWKIKKSINKYGYNSEIEDIYNFCIKNGASAGRLLGAGNGGFFIFYTKNKKLFSKILLKNKLKMLDIKLSSEGPKIIKCN